MAKTGYRGEALKAAKDLSYDKSVIRQIEKIMCTARNRPPDQKKKARTVTRCLSSNNFTWCM